MTALMRTEPFLTAGMKEFRSNYSVAEPRRAGIGLISSPHGASPFLWLIPARVFIKAALLFPKERRCALFRKKRFQSRWQLMSPAS